MKYSTTGHDSAPPERPLRVLFHINDFGNGGTETALLSWLNMLDRRYFSPSLSVGYPTDELASWRARSIPEDVPVHVLASQRWMHAWHDEARGRKLGRGKKLLHKLLTYAAIRPLAGKRFREIAGEHDIVCDFDFSLRHLAGSGDLPWFGVSHFSLATRLGSKSARYRARRIRQYLRYSAFAVLTPDMFREATDLLASTGLAILELPNVIDLEAIRRNARAAVDKAAERFIVSVARLDEGQKDHRTLLRAYAQARTRMLEPVDLVLIGEGRDRGVLEQLVDELGIRASVHFLGFCGNPFPHIRQAEMLVLSSRYEGLPMVLSEAMALGTPVISTDCPTGPRDQLDGGNAGLLVTVGDVEGMAQSIERLLTDNDLRTSLTRHARAKVETFSALPANERMLALARQLLASHGTTRQVSVS
ncbi:glycosyltransferase [Paraburkholderia sartisoli]|uniref:Glycosyltransferase involved in cell wall bisynthesis n=1 Tax=Paraburkholderia sartisoli TaxID=83784 RepID=A0A1H4C3R5_9BURK|nr:glycosyltransferase [Paraburkholderia sartisoli]SEA54990.1 Glycosyltransferase involved in cell wall bisynthesis [Paraburkholderia sartisoli]